jgi:nitrogen fixation protein FixH
MSTSDNAPATGKELTGRKVFMIFVGAFTIIFGVNFYMAREAIHTFPGLEVENSYVASQTFDADRAAQEALGWDVSAAIEGSALKLDIVGRDGLHVMPAKITASLGRATERTDDQDLVFSQNSLGSLVADVGELGGGKWDLRLEAIAGNGSKFRQRIVLMVPES